MSTQIEFLKLICSHRMPYFCDLNLGSMVLIWKPFHRQMIQQQLQGVKLVVYDRVCMK